MRAAVVCLALGACGRIGFDALSPIAHVQPLVHAHVAGPIETVPIAIEAAAVGDAVVLVASCTTTTTPPTTVTVTAPGWSFSPIGPLTGSAAVKHFAATFGAIVTDTSQAQLTATWDASCSTAVTILGDEFAGADPTGGATTFDGHAEIASAGACSVSVPIAHAGDVVWGACDAEIHQTGAGAGYTVGADDQLGDFAEYKVATDATEIVDYSGISQGIVELAVTIRP